MSTTPLNVTFEQLRTRHHALLFDAYGVLIDADGALPGAVAAIRTLNRARQPFLVVTNDASRSGERAAFRLVAHGLDVREDQVLSSGMLVAPALAESCRPGDRVVVIGTEDSADYARAAGVVVVEPTTEDPADAVVVADECVDALLDVLDKTLSMIVAGVHRGRTPRLLLANPDLIYPEGPQRFGFTAGSLARMIEGALGLLLGDAAPTFEPLGKPSARIFQEAIARVGTRDAVMIGDQLPTDIAGARAAGLAAALVLGGVSSREAALAAGDGAPNYILESL